MADVDLQTILNSGDLTNIFIGGVTSDKRVVIVSDLSAYVAKDGTTTQDLIKLTPQPSAPSHFESNVYYDDIEKSLTVQTDITDFNHNLGQEMVLRVVNRTGSTILNGSVCTGGGTDVTTELPSVKLAQADTFQNAQIIGMATHDIANNTEGFVTSYGFVRDFDTSGITQGVPAYLSATVPGGLTNVQPDIISRVGGCLISDSLVGKFFVNPLSSLNLPNVFGILQGQTLGDDTYAVTTSSQPLDNYDTENNVVMTTTPLTGLISIPQDGTYDAVFTIQMTFSSSPSTRTVYFELYDGSSNIYVYPYNIAKDATSAASSFTLPFVATSGQDISMNIRGSTSITVTISNISFSIKSLDIR